MSYLPDINGKQILTNKAIKVHIRIYLYFYQVFISKNMKKFEIFICLFAMFILGCAKEESTKPTSPSVKLECKPLTTITEYSSTGNLKFEQIYTYDTNGLEIEMKSYQEFAGQRTLEEETKNFQHDGFGNISYSERWDGKGNLIERRNSTYFAYKKALLHAYNPWVGGNSLRIELTYNSNDQLIGAKRYMDNVFVSERKNYQHDRFGNETYWEHVDTSGSAVAIESYTFVAFEKWLTRKVELSNGSVQEYHERMYDANGNRIASKYFYLGKLTFEERNFRHDQHGNDIYYETFDSTGTKISSTTSTYFCF